MNSYLIIYELRNPKMDYLPFYSAIKSLGRWGMLTQSSWLVVTEWNIISIRDLLQSKIGSEDRLLVVLSGKQAAWKSIIAPNDWIKTNIVI